MLTLHAKLVRLWFPLSAVCGNISFSSQDNCQIITKVKTVTSKTKNFYRQMVIVIDRVSKSFLDKKAF